MLQSARLRFHDLETPLLELVTIQTYFYNFILTLTKNYSRLSGCVEGEEMPLAGGTSRGPAQCSPARRLDASSCDVSSLSSGEEDERLRRYRTAPHHTLLPPAQSIQASIKIAPRWAPMQPFRLLCVRLLQ